MCAEKIQAVFRGYLVRKYHCRGLKQLREFRSKLEAAALGWKARQILRCRKMREEMAVIRAKQAEVDREETIRDNPNSYSLKKL